MAMVGPGWEWLVSETLSRPPAKTRGGRANKVRIRVGQLFRQVGVKLDAFANFALLQGFVADVSVYGCNFNTKATCNSRNT